MYPDSDTDSGCSTSCSARSLIAAALSNMGERFGYYIMNAVLLLFLASKFGISDKTAGWIYAVFYFSIYVLALPGGLVADRLRNYKGTIITGLLVMAVGYGMLSVPVFGESFTATTGKFSGILVLLYILATADPDASGFQYTILLDLMMLSSLTAIGVTLMTLYHTEPALPPSAS